MRRLLVPSFAIALVLTSCTSPVDEPTPGPSRASDAPSTPTATAASATFERDLRRLLSVPPLPAFSIPTNLLSTPEHERIADELDVAPGLYDGIAVVDARCVEDSAAAADSGPAVVGASQHYEDDTVSITVAGDGTGVYDAEDLHIAVLPGGAGVYEDGETRLSVQADGSGTYSSGDRRYTVRADGSGAYSDDDVRVWVEAGGVGGYEDDTMRLSISAAGEVFGDGTPERVAAVRAVLADGLPRFPAVPAITMVEPTGTVCGAVIRLDANVMFDLNSADVRPEGQAEIAKVAALLAALGSPRAQINGHTDQIGDEGSNLDLSERRAGSVRDLLAGGGVDAGSLETRGFGETQPLRVETLPDGSDDPAARQLNRRVEIVLIDQP